MIYAMGIEPAAGRWFHACFTVTIL